MYVCCITVIVTYTIKIVKIKKSAEASFTVDGICGAEAICNMWKNHYNYGLLNSSSDFNKQNEVSDILNDLNGEIIERISPEDIDIAVKPLKMGKCGGRGSINGSLVGLPAVQTN